MPGAGGESPFDGLIDAEIQILKQSNGLQKEMNAPAEVMPEVRELAKTLGVRGFDPQSEDRKAQEVAQWALTKFKVSSPEEFMSFMDRIDRDTRDRFRGRPLLDRAWMVMQESTAFDAMVKLSNGQ
jgi:hypothetical protein